MKRFFFTLISHFLAAYCFAGSGQAANANFESPSANSNFIIDYNDTIVFDISQAFMNGTTVEFPVYILTGDTVNALDFSLQYDQVNFTLDSILNLTTYLTGFYNQNMGTLYYTSYSLQPLDINTPLISVRLNMLGHVLCSGDLDSIHVFLNGDPCSFKVVECLSDGISAPEVKQPVISVSPNPSFNEFTIRTSSAACVQLLDMHGRLACPAWNAIGEEEHHFYSSEFPPGIYLVKADSKSGIATTRIVIR